MSLFEVRALTTGYGKKKIIENLSFEAPKHTLTAILGSNGCGKTTLLKAICGILPYEGDCVLQGRSLKHSSARQIAKLCSYIPQRSGIQIDISVLDVVLMGFNPRLHLLEHPSKKMVEEAVYYLKLVGLGNQIHQNFMTLSEGQKQLCILARALVSEGQMLLLDEPESSLDISHRAKLLAHVNHWASEKERCALIILHDPNLALNSCHQLLLLQEGRKVSMISPKTDSLEKIEQELSLIYGDVSLVSCTDKKGNSHLVMLKEDNL